jgi:Flp pilus assembly protein TadD
MAVASQLSVPGGEEDAVRMGLAFLRSFPEDHAVAGLLGVAFARAEVPEARTLLESGMQASRPEPEVAFLLGLAVMKEGRDKRAQRLFERELQGNPKHLKAAQALIDQHNRLGDHSAILQVASEALLHSRKDVYLLHAKSQALFNLKNFASCRTELDLALLHHPKASALLLLDANLLSKEGKTERGAARFEQAKAARESEAAAKAP